MRRRGGYDRGGSRAGPSRRESASGAGLSLGAHTNRRRVRGLARARSVRCDRAYRRAAGAYPRALAGSAQGWRPPRGAGWTRGPGSCADHADRERLQPRGHRAGAVRADDGQSTAGTLTGIDGAQRNHAMFDLAAIQQSLRESGLDGWLLYDFRASNVLARRVLDMETKPAGSRRFLYMIPATGEPTKLVHRIETATLDHLPGGKIVYLTWQELEAGIARLVGAKRRVAMEYAPRVSNPYVSKVDAGTLEVVRGCGIDLTSSGDLIQQFEATWDDDQWQMHREAEKCTTSAYDLAWGLIADRIRTGGTIRETEVQAAIMAHFHRHGMTTYSPPIVGVGPHSGDPHYEPVAGTDAAIGPDEFV